MQPAAAAPPDDAPLTLQLFLMRVDKQTADLSLCVITRFIWTREEVCSLTRSPHEGVSGEPFILRFSSVHIQ